MLKRLSHGYPEMEKLTGQGGNKQRHEVMVAFGRTSLLLKIQVRNTASIDDLAHIMPMHIDYQSGQTI